MNIKNKINAVAILALLVAYGITGCQKMSQPPLGDYPQDANPPGGPLKFFAAYDGGSVDSIRANYGVDNDVAFADGVSGKALDASSNGYVVYPSANDFSKVTSFTLSFWVKKNGPNAAGKGTAFAFGLATTTDIWTRQDMFLEFEDAGNPSTADSAAAKFYLKDQWFEFTGAKRLHKVLDGQWHHLVFSFDQTTSTLTPYLDGAAVAGLPAGFGKFNNNSGKVDFSPIAGLVVGAPGHFAIGKTPDDWMGNFNGDIDQFRLYGEALSAADVAQLYANKE